MSEPQIKHSPDCDIFDRSLPDGIIKPCNCHRPTIIHEDCNIGLQMEDARVVEIHNAHGQHYWKATSKIGSIFGSEVEGEIVGYGRTKEQALERLKEETRKLADSLWA